jgi:hypothetical protein
MVLTAASAFARSSDAGTNSGYGGLGATVSAFYSQNTHGSGTPPVGLVYYAVDATKNGRVSAFHIVINARPPFSARERISQVGGIDLPADATETNLNSNYCLVWHSKKLGKLIGMSYAAATTGSDNTVAYMRAESKPHC